MVQDRCGTGLDPGLDCTGTGAVTSVPVRSQVGSVTSLPVRTTGKTTQSVPYMRLREACLLEWTNSLRNGDAKKLSPKRHQDTVVETAKNNNN
ncbi:UNVERIFIED_CONTAM: hypothetical protein FKN15_059228 [Acipenser sinensis]